MALEVEDLGLVRRYRLIWTNRPNRPDSDYDRLMRMMATELWPLTMQCIGEMEKSAARRDNELLRNNLARMHQLLLSLPAPGTKGD
jgi:hypothetical protein